MKQKSGWRGISVLAGFFFTGTIFCAEPVAPRFPDTELPVLSREGDLMGNQGMVYVSGALLIAPCVLSDWASEIQGQNWIGQDVRQVTLALEGCGDGMTYTGLRQNAPLPVRSFWKTGTGTEYFFLRLNDGVNYLTLPVSDFTSGMRLEMAYE